MHIRHLVLLGAAALALLTLPTTAAAEDTRPAAAGYVLVYPDNVARFHVTRDLKAGTMVFTSDGVAVKEAPVITLRSTTSTKPILVTAEPGDGGTWRVTHELLRTEQFDGEMAIVVNERKYTAPLVLTAVRTPRHGGQMLNLCEGDLEVVHDIKAGTLQVFADENAKLSAPPTVTLSEPKDAGEVKLEAIAGKPNAWQAKSDLFKSTKVCAKLTANIDGKTCEAEIAFLGTHGGRIVKWEAGPRYELVTDKDGYRVYFLDETWDGRTYVVENPEIVYGTGETARTVRLEPIPNEPRAYRVAGIDAGLMRPGDARMRLSLFGRSLETNLGVSGAGINLR